MADSCGITNFATCLPDKFFTFLLGGINSSVDSMLEFVKNMLPYPATIESFSVLWGIMIYIISMFYGLLFMWSGFQFMISGYDAEKREKAKMWLKNTIIMILLVQTSYFLYQLANEIAGLLSAGILTLIPSTFFTITNEETNVAMTVYFGIPLFAVLLIACILLIIRFLVTSLGVALFPIGIFLYFLEPTTAYGKMILNFIFTNIFISFFVSITILAFSKMTELVIFSDYKIILMIAAYLCVSLVIIFGCWFSVIKSAMSATNPITSMIAGKK